MSASMIRDGETGGGSSTGSVLSAGGYTVDIDSLRQTANRVLGVADRVESVGERRSMHGAQEYGYVLPGAATRWADRFTYLLDGLADEVEHAGYELRGTADAYTEVEIAVERRSTRLHDRLGGAG
jgi:hypothetical protein